MTVNVLIFGQLTDIAGSAVILNKVKDTDTLRQVLVEKYPELGKRKFMISVNKKVAAVNTPLNDNCTVALLPPFSGG